MIRAAADFNGQTSFACLERLSRRRAVIDNYDRLWLLAGENERNDPTDERDTEKEVEYDNSRGVRAFSLDGHDRGQKIKGQYQK